MFVLPHADSALVLVEACDAVHAEAVLVVGSALSGLPEWVRGDREVIHLFSAVRLWAVLVKAVASNEIAAKVSDMVLLLVVLLKGRQIAVCWDNQGLALHHVVLVVDIGRRESGLEGTSVHADSTERVGAN